MEILATVGYIVLCVLLFSLAIAIHEFGHFIVALKLGLRVERFSIGFGPAIWKKKYKGVEYRVSWIPLGGYVSIPDVDPEGTKAIEGESSGKKERIPAWKEFLVALAGPAMNVVLAVVLAVILSLIPSARFGQMSTEIGGFTAGSVSKAAGLMKGDVITAVGGHPVETWTELQTEVQISNGEPTEFRVKRPRALAVERTLEKPDRNEPLPIIVGFWPESAAEAAGLRVGDRIASVNGERVRTLRELAPLVAEADPGASMALTAVRGEEELAFTLTPARAKAEVGEGAWAVGNFLQVFTSTNDFATVVSVPIPQEEREYDEVTVTIAPKRNEASGAYYIEATSLPSKTGAVSWMPARNPIAQLAWDAGSIFRVLKALVTPSEAKGTGKAVGGPVLIAEGIYRSLRRDFWDGIGFLRFLNTNLAIMNLLPIPVLDGGLILFALIALVFRRRVPDKIVGILSMGFMYLLLGLMALLIFTDSRRSWRIHHAEDPADAIELVVPEGGGYAV